jgi:hypothetical protein
MARPFTAYFVGNQGWRFSHGLETGQGGSDSISHEMPHYLVGPTGELHLPFGLSFEVDALYRPLNYTVYPQNLRATAFTGSDWQFPLLLKYQLHKGILVHPFVDAGVTFRHVSFSNVPLGNSNTAGVSLGGGLTFKLLFLRFSPELRYTYFPTDVFGTNVHSTSNQADFLVGLTF